MDAHELARWTRFAAKGGIGKCTAIVDCIAQEMGEDLMFLKASLLAQDVFCARLTISTGRRDHGVDAVTRGWGLSREPSIHSYGFSADAQTRAIVKASLADFLVKMSGFLAS